MTKSQNVLDFPFPQIDNHHLIFYEYSGLEPGDSQGLRAIREFILSRTDPSSPASGRLHAIW